MRKFKLLNIKGKSAFMKKCKFDTLGKGDTFYYTSKYSKDKQTSFGCARPSSGEGFFFLNNYNSCCNNVYDFFF